MTLKDAYDLVTEQGRGSSRAYAESVAPPFMPVVTLGEVSRPVEAMVESAPVVARREAAAPALRGPVPARLRAQLPNGVTLELECGGRDGALVKAMIEALGAR